MVKHIVMFKFLEEALGQPKEQNLIKAKELLEGLNGVVPTIRSSEVHLGSPDADSSNYDLVLIAEFDDMAGLSSYIVHPAHVEAGKFIGGVRESRACVDYFM